MSAPILCVDSERLRALLDDRASTEEQEELGGHLETCANCRAAFEKMAAESRWWDEARAAIDLPADPREPVEDELALDFLDPPETTDAIGKLGVYDVLEVVGRGGMGVVFKGYDSALRRVVAIKVLAPQLAAGATARKRFQREARAAASISHDHVVAIHAVDEFKGFPYIVMPFIAGKSLQERIDRDGPLEVKEVLRIGMQAAFGLSAAHAQGLIHRDVKPANILLENGVERVKLTDFGLARAVDDATITQSWVIAGTPQYMAPEQARGEAIDHRADLFSLGSVLYAMCAGHSPFRARTTMAVLRKVSDERHKPLREANPDVPPWLATIVDRLLSKDPNKRPQTAAEVADLLEKRLAKLQDPSAHLETIELQPRPRLVRFVAARPLRIAAVLALAIGLIFASDAFGVTHVGDLVATILRIKTADGTLVLQIDDPNVKVTLDGKDVVISEPGVREIRVRPGLHRLLASKGNAPEHVELFTVARGGKQTVRVGLEPPAAKYEVAKSPAPGDAINDDKEHPRELSDQVSKDSIAPPPASNPAKSAAPPIAEGDERIRELESNRDIAAAEVARAKAKLAQAEADLNYRRAALKRVENLVKDRSLEPRMLEEERHHFAAGEAAVEVARAELTIVEIRLKEADFVLKNPQYESMTTTKFAPKRGMFGVRWSLILEMDRDLAAAELTKAKAKLLRAEADLKYRRAELNRIEDLVKHRAIEQRMLEEERERFDAAGLAVDEARAGLKIAEIRLKQAEDELKRAQAESTPTGKNESRVETKPESVGRQSPNPPKAETPGNLDKATLGELRQMRYEVRKTEGMIVADQTALEKARTDVLEAKTTLEQAVAERTAGESEFKRIEKLIESKAMGLDMLDKARAKVVQEKAKLAVCEDSVEKAEANFDFFRCELGDSRIQNELAALAVKNAEGGDRATFKSEFARLTLAHAKARRETARAELQVAAAEFKRALDASTGQAALQESLDLEYRRAVDLQKAHAIEEDVLLAKKSALDGSKAKAHSILLEAGRAQSKFTLAQAHLKEAEREGKAIEESHSLAEEKTRRLTDARDLAAAELTKAKAKLLRAEADLNYRRAERVRVEDLVEHHSLERRMLEEERQHFAATEAAVEEASADVKIAEIRLKHAEEELKRETNQKTP